MGTVQTNVCVFCGANDGSNPAFAEAATEFGERLAEAGFGLVYGAGGTGIMGAVSDGALSRHGYVTGVIPRDMMDREWGRKDISRLHIVSSIHERKAHMYSLSSAFVTLPGGYGTLDECFEAITWTQLDYHHTKSIPSLVLNVEGYWDHLKALLDHARNSELIRPDDRDLVTFVDSVDELMTQLMVRCPPQCSPVSHA